MTSESVLCYRKACFSLPNVLFSVLIKPFSCCGKGFSVRWKRASFSAVAVMYWHSEVYADTLKTAYMAADCLSFGSALFSARLRCAETRCFSTMRRDVPMGFNPNLSLERRFYI